MAEPAKGTVELTGSTALNRSQASAEAETGSIDSPVNECQGWIGVRAVYDDPWTTPITDCQVRIEVSGNIVADGPRTKGLLAFGKEDGQPHDNIRAELGGYRQRGVKSGPAVIALVPNGDPGLAKVFEKQIHSQLSAFETSMQALLRQWVEEWSKQGWWSIPEAKRRGQIRGLGAWWEGEVDFWASASNVAETTLKGIKSGASKFATWHSEQPFGKRILPLPLLVGVELGEWVWNGAVDLWKYRDQLMRLFKAFSSGSVAAIESALEALVDLPDELGTLFKALVRHSADWVQNMIEVARETDVFKRAINTIMAVVMMMTPNFWAEGIGMVEGYLLPEVLITIALIVIGALCTAAGAMTLATRVGGMLSKLRKAIGAAGKAGEVLITLFGKLDELAGLIGNLSKALRRRISEVRRGGTDSVNQLTRKTFIRFRNDYDEHVIKRDPGVKRSRGIGGAHNKAEFMKSANEINIVKVEPHPSLPGVSNIHYQMQALDKTQKPTGAWGSTIFEKTVYDPAIISDEQYLQWGRQAAAEAQEAGRLTRQWEGFTPDGIKMRGYLDETGAVRSFFFDF